MLLICGYGVVANAQQTLTVGDVRLYSGTTDWRYYAVTCTSDRPITSITISMINNEIPNTPATPTNSLMKESKSRLYDPRTFVYTFGNPITATQVVNFIKSITFRKEPNRHPGATPYVNITIDSNPTSLPNGATVTAWNAHPDGTTHYYVWVTAKSNEKTYKHAYDAAKLYYFQGM